MCEFVCARVVPVRELYVCAVCVWTVVHTESETPYTVMYVRTAGAARGRVCRS